MKIRTRLSIWYFAVSIFIVVLLSTTIYWSMHRLLYQAIDDDLEIFSDMIESSYNPIFGQFEETVWQLESAKRYQEVYLIVYSLNKKVIFASPMTQFVYFEMPLPEKTIELGFTSSAKVKANLPMLNTDNKGNVTFRGITRKMFYNNKPIGWIQVGLPITKVENDLSNLFDVILLVNVFAVLLVGIGGYYIIGKFLYPVKIITDKAQKISSSNLSERIEIQNEQDELGHLTLTLNNLLERLSRSFDTQRNFMADAAHELKTPLTVLRAHWENELNNKKLNNDFKERLAQDVEQISRLNQLINKLLFLSQTEDVYEKLNLSTFQLDEFLRDIIDDARILADLKQQTIDAIELVPTSIQADREQLYQLFFNLIDNAIKYTPENGKIWIALREQDNEVQIKIRDNGPGIEQENLAKIFERFYRVDKDRSRKSGGSGLGLSICKLVVNAHKGSISVESKLKQGTTFIVNLPANSPS